MKEFEIKLSDIHRMLIGEVPYHFYLEVIFRVAFVYLILMVSMRLMGKRMATQLGRNEMAAVSSLAAAIGVPLMNPDRGLLPAVVIAAVIIAYQTFVARKAAVNKKFESLTQDEYNMLVKDGVLNISAMTLTRVSRDRVFAQLRYEGITQLGEVKRLYFEAGGSFSILTFEKHKPGLSIIPDWDGEMSSDLHKSTNQQLCAYCGYQDPGLVNDGKVCGNCKHKKWVSAVTSVA
ncbi:MAG TPA: YetF domain-containing protein [Pedobacter sp.]|jgi:uncharacterized membrane protein YcaP (DUF421 family)